MLKGPLSGCRLLLADDVADTRRVLQVLLERAGAEVAACPDGASALEACESASLDGAPFDAALLDLVMPDVDGLGAAVKLRAGGFSGGLVGISAHATPQAAECWLAAGCDAVLPKNVPASLLVATLADACLRRGRPHSPAAA